MHQQNIIHLDLKPENIVCVDHTGTSIKVIDFGLASRLDPNTPLKVMHGTPEFVAPEVISYEPVCLATDMWSIGVICYILLSGESPFQGNSDDETLALVTAAQWEFDEDSFEEITEQAKDFISSLLNKNTRRRMTCEEALAHPWMVSVRATGYFCSPRIIMVRVLCIVCEEIRFWATFHWNSLQNKQELVTLSQNMAIIKDLETLYFCFSTVL
uniref:Myosin, light chain kinase 5 n=1 Tax=Myripristis murdjan TaxID=586833 RepID=A0A667WQ32_9TELE